MVSLLLFSSHEIGNVERNKVPREHWEMIEKSMG